MEDKKAISTLVATVLLILLVVIIILIIWRSLIPIINNSTELGKICSDARLRIDTSEGYSCYSTARKYTSTMIVQESSTPLEGIQISLASDGQKISHIVKRDPKLIFLAEFEATRDSSTFDAISGKSFPLIDAVLEPGKLGNALKSNGVSTYGTATLNDTNIISIETWVKPE